MPSRHEGATIKRDPELGEIRIFGLNSPRIRRDNRDMSAQDGL